MLGQDAVEGLEPFVCTDMRMNQVEMYTVLRVSGKGEHTGAFITPPRSYFQIFGC